MIVVKNSIIPTESEITSSKKTKGVNPRLEHHSRSEILRRYDGVSGVVKGGPGSGGGVGENEVAGFEKRGGGDRERGGVGVPDGVGRAVEEAESAGGEEVEGGGGVHWGGARGPDGDPAGVEDGGDEGVGLGEVDGEEAEREGGLRRGPCLAWVGSVES